MPLIRSEIHAFIHDYLRLRDPKSFEKLRGNVGALRNRVNAVFLGDKKINPSGVSLTEHFASTSKKELKTKIIRAREQLGIYAEIPLGQWVSLAESIVTHDDNETRQQYDEIFETGLLQTNLRKNLRFDNQYENRDLQFLINNQSGEVNRSIVEVASNAIDFSTEEQVVEVTVYDDGYDVLDYGKGMDAEALIEQLSIPFISGARNKSKASIGRFGMGFLTILRHLQSQNDTVTIQTSKGGKGYRLQFRYDKGAIVVSVGTQDTVTQGTKISLYAKNFKPENAKHLLKSHLQYKRGAQVQLNGESIISLENHTFISAQQDELRKTSVGYVPGPFERSYSEIVVAINGIRVQSSSTFGMNLPESLILDLPYVTNLSESRDQVVYDEVFISAIKQIIDQLISANISNVEKIQVINALAEVLSKAELNAYSGTESLTTYLENKIADFLTREKLSPLPAEKGWEYVDVENAVFLSKKLKKPIDTFLSGLLPIRGFRSSTLRGYVVPFKPNSPQPVAVSDSTVVIDAAVYEQLKDHDYFLSTYLSFLLKDNGSLTISNESITTTKDNEEKIQARFRGKTYIDTSIERVLQLDSRELYQISSLDWKMIHRSISKMLDDEDDIGDLRSVLKWLRTFTFGKELEENIISYLNRETNAIHFDADTIERVIELHEMSPEQEEFDIPPATRAKIYDMIRELVSKKRELESGFEHLRELKSFFSPEHMSTYFSLPVEQIEQTLCADFITTFGDLFAEEIESETKNLERNRAWEMRYHGDDYELDEDLLSIYTYTFLGRICNDRYDGGMKGLPLVRDIESSISFRINNVLLSLIAYRNYTTIKATLQPQEQKSFDALLQLHWGEKISNPDDIFLKGGRKQFGEEKKSNFAILTTVAKVARLIPPEMLDEEVDVLVRDPFVEPEQLIYILSILVDPYAAVHTIGGNRWGGSRDIDSRANTVIVLSSENETGMDLFRTFFRGDEYFQNQYQYMGIKTMDEYQAYAENKHSLIANGFTHFINKHRTIYNDPQISRILQLRQADIENVEFENREEKGFETFNTKNIIYNTEGLFSPLSETKYKTIQETVQEHFNPEFMSREDCKKFHCYLRRVMIMTHVSDEDFSFIQPWLLITSTFGPTEKYRELFSTGMVETLIEKKALLVNVGLKKVAEIWEHIIDNYNSFIEKRGSSPYPVYLGRLIDIIADISTFPTYRQERILNTLRGNEYHKYESLATDTFDPDVLPYGIKPYVMYFRDGNTELLEKTNYYDRLEEGDHDVLLSELIHFRRTTNTTYTKHLLYPDELSSKIGNHAQSKNMFVYHRELLHAITHLPANDVYLFLRELIQNAYDISSSASNERQVIKVDTYKRGKYFITQVEDEVGMSFATIFSKLLIPNVSSKEEGTQLGRFGVGFMSIFKDAERVEIVSSDGTLATIVVVTPIKDEQGRLVDLNISYATEKTTGRGTQIKKFSTVSNPAMEVSKVRAATEQYGKHLDANTVELQVNDTQVNVSKPTLASHNHPVVGTLEVLDGPDTLLLQGNLYVNTLPDYVQDLIPNEIKEIVLAHGLTINIDRKVRLTRSRSEVADKHILIPYFKKVLPALIIEATVKKFGNGKLKLDMIPYDFFWTDGIYNTQRISNTKIQRDADIINNGDAIDDWEYYKDKNNLLELATLIKTFEINGTKLSLREINLLPVQTDYDFGPNFPEKLKELLKKRVHKVVVENKRREEFAYRQEPEVHATVISPRLRRKLLQRSDAHLAFLDIIKVITHVNFRIEHGYWNVAKAAGAAAVNNQLKIWNLYYHDTNIEYLATLIRNNNVTPKTMSEFLARIIDTSTHEDAHLNLGTSHWGDHHNKSFWELQLRIWGELMTHSTTLIQQAVEVTKQYKGTCLDRPAIAKLLSEN